MLSYSKKYGIVKNDIVKNGIVKNIVTPAELFEY